MVVASGGHASVNLLCFPGVTDTEAELEALSDLIERTGLHMLQLRNLNIDPDLYRARAAARRGAARAAACAGCATALARRFPKLRFGYFNPALGGRV